MSNIKINTDLFLGKQELRRFERFLKNDGYVRFADMTISKFGLLNDYVNDTTFQNLKVVAGSSPTTISLKAGFGLNDSFEIINVPNDVIDVNTIASDSIDRYISIQHLTTNIEVGTVDILANGTITGAGTLFTEVLRSQPNFASRIRFPNSILNTNIYEVVTVTDDLNILVSGNLQAETSVDYVVVGTFTPDKIIPALQQDIFVYDSFILVVGLTDIGNNTNNFNLAKVQTNGLSMTIVDLRNKFIETKGSYELKDIDRISNPLIGIEEIKYDTIFSAKDESLVRIGWGFRGITWTIDLQTKTLVISAGRGGAHEDPTFFTTGEFDGWRCYFKETGKFIDVVTSTLVGSTIELNLRNVNGNDITAGVLANDVIVVPNSDEIYITFEGVDSPNTKVGYLLPIQIGREDLKVKIEPTSSEVYVRYNYVHNKQSTSIRDINDGDYYNETAFDSDGLKINNNISLVVFSQYTPKLHSNNHHFDKAWLSKANVVKPFQEQNKFNNGIGFAKGVDRDVSLTPIPDNNPSLDISTTDGNFLKLTDSNTYGEVRFIKSDNIGTAIWINIEIRAAVILKHNFVPTAAETLLGYLPIYNQGGLNINAAIGDFVTFVEYNGIWNVVNIWRKDGALDSTQANIFPITGLDNKCFSFIDNKLGTILQDIINKLCSMSTGNSFAFRAKNTLDTLKTISGTSGVYTSYNFDDDVNTPYFDNGNDMYVDKYIVPIGGIKQKFIVENINWAVSGVSGTLIVHFGIYKSTDNGLTWVFMSGQNLANQTTPLATSTPVTGYTPSIVTDYDTLNQGDWVAFLATKDSGSSTNGTFKVMLGSIFSNSFE